VLCVVEDEDRGQEAVAMIRDLGDPEPVGAEPRNTVFLVPLTAVEHF
jgi:hypothetical protein